MIETMRRVLRLSADRNFAELDRMLDAACAQPFELHVAIVRGTFTVRSELRNWERARASLIGRSPEARAVVRSLTVSRDWSGNP